VIRKKKSYRGLMHEVSMEGCSAELKLVVKHIKCRK